MMSHYVFMWIVLISISYAYGTSPTLQRLKPLNSSLTQGPTIIEVERIKASYQDLVDDQGETSDYLNLGNLLYTLHLIGNLEDSLNQTFAPFKELDNRKRDGIKAVLRSLVQNVENFLNQGVLLQKPGILYKIQNIFSGVLEGATDLTRFVKLMDPTMVSMGTNAETKTSTTFRNTIKACLGRIFVIQNDTVTDFASGMIVPHIENGEKKYDQIITCGHGMNPRDTDPDQEFYFVRSEYLEPRTGLPSIEEIRTDLELSPEQTGQVGNLKLAEFLRKKCRAEQNEVRRIVRFTPFAVPSHRSSAILSDHSPRYLPHQDNGFGHLETGFHLSHELVPIVLLNHLPTGKYTYCALGYPIVKHFDTSSESKMMQEMKFSPLTISLCNSVAIDTQDNPLLKLGDDGRLQHGAPTGPGMSGGPVVFFDEQNKAINVLGVIAAGDMDHNYMCKFW